MSVREAKLCLLGETGVGKTSIVIRFVSESFKLAQESTVGASFMTKTIIVNDTTYKFQIWDTAGQERYRALAPMYYRSAAAAIVVYDVTRKETFEMVKEWISELKKNVSPKVVIAIAGNKCDLDDQREVSKEEAQGYAERIGVMFVETSALTATNVPELFDDIAKALPSDTLHPPPGSVKMEEKKETHSRSCCGASRS